MELRPARLTYLAIYAIVIIMESRYSPEQQANIDANRRAERDRLDGIARNIAANQAAERLQSEQQATDTAASVAASRAIEQATHADHVANASANRVAAAK